MNRGSGERGRGRIKHQTWSEVRAGEIAGLTDAAHPWGEKNKERDRDRQREEGTDI